TRRASSFFSYPSANNQPAPSQSPPDRAAASRSLPPRPKGGLPTTRSKLPRERAAGPPSRRPSAKNQRLFNSAGGCSPGSISTPVTCPGASNPILIPEERKIPSPAAGSITRKRERSPAGTISFSISQTKTATRAGVKNCPHTFSILTACREDLDHHGMLITVGEFRAVDTFLPDLVRHLFFID